MDDDLSHFEDEAMEDQMAGDPFPDKLTKKKTKKEKGAKVSEGLYYVVDMAPGNDPSMTLKTVVAIEDRIEARVKADVEARMKDLEKALGEATGAELSTQEWLGDSEGNKEGMSTTDCSSEADDESDCFLDENKVAFSEDTNTFILSSHPYSVPFGTAILVVVLKICIFAMVLTNTYKDADNKWPIPPMVSTPVLFAQFLAILISVLTQNDVLNAVLAIHYGFSDTFLEYFGKYDAGREWQWRLSTGLGFLAGAVGLGATFILIIVSSTVLDVLLNFAAVEFVATLDETTFELARMGVLGKANKRACKRLLDEEDEIKKFCVKERRWSGPRVRTCGMVFLLAAVLGCWLLVFYRQKQGDFARQAIYVQFDDEARPDLASHSGVYKINKDPTNARDGFIYIEERGLASTIKKGYFQYCSEKENWEFYLLKDSPKEPCKNTAILKSAKIKSHDIQAASGETWYVNKDDTGNAHSEFVVMEGFFLTKICEEDNDCGPAGKCDKKSERCECRKDFGGIRCSHNLTSTCPRLGLDEGLVPFPVSSRVGNEFNWTQQDGTCYDYPIFYNDKTESVMFFTGLRWAVSRVKDLFTTEETTDYALRKLVTREFHASEVQSVATMSEPVFYQTSLGTKSTPIDLEWLKVASEDDPLDKVVLSETSDPAKLLCATCNNDDDCTNKQGTCEEGKCECNYGTWGSKCQVTPEGNGRCDPFFNREQFNFDGGDCCPSTCLNTQGNICGSFNLGRKTIVETGFPQCADPNELGSLERVPHYSTTKGFELQSLAGFSQIDLSTNGRIMLVSEPVPRTIRVFARSGSEWEQLGNGIVTPYDEDQWTTKAAIASDYGGFRGGTKQSLLAMVSVTYNKFEKNSCDPTFYYFSHVDQRWFESEWTHHKSGQGVLCKNSGSEKVVKIEYGISYSRSAADYSETVLVRRKNNPYRRLVEATDYYGEDGDGEDYYGEDYYGEDGNGDRDGEDNSEGYEEDIDEGYDDDEEDGNFSLSSPLVPHDKNGAFYLYARYRNGVANLWAGPNKDFGQGFLQFEASDATLSGNGRIMVILPSQTRRDQAFILCEVNEELFCKSLAIPLSPEGTILALKLNWDGSGLTVVTKSTENENLARIYYYKTEYPEKSWGHSVLINRNKFGPKDVIISGGGSAVALLTNKTDEKAFSNDPFLRRRHLEAYGDDYYNDGYEDYYGYEDDYGYDDYYGYSDDYDAETESRFNTYEVFSNSEGMFTESFAWKKIGQYRTQNEVSLRLSDDGSIITRLGRTGDPVQVSELSNRCTDKEALFAITTTDGLEENVEWFLKVGDRTIAKSADAFNLEPRFGEKRVSKVCISKEDVRPYLKLTVGEDQETEGQGTEAEAKQRKFIQGDYFAFLFLEDSTILLGNSSKVHGRWFGD